MKCEKCDNVITNVECACEERSYDDIYHIFVFADNTIIDCIQYSGSDNGFYGTGYDLFVRVSQ